MSTMNQYREALSKRLWPVNGAPAKIRAVDLARDVTSTPPGKRPPRNDVVLASKVLLENLDPPRKGWAVKEVGAATTTLIFQRSKA